MAERLSFHQGIQFAWDSTSLRVAEECWTKYHYSIILSRSLRKESVHLTFGLYYHSAMEFFARCRSEGIDYETALHRTVLRTLIQSQGFFSDDPYKTRFTLIRTIIWYLEEHITDPATTILRSDGSPAVELSFRFQLPLKLAGQDALYCGHLDRLVEYQGKVYVADHKTTKSALAHNYFEKFNPDTQMSGYTLGAKITYHQPIVGVIIDAAQIGVGFSRFARGFTLRQPSQLEEWLEHTCYHISLVEHYVKTDFWPMNRSSCDKWGGCPFRPVCARPPKQRIAWLTGDYTTREWDPLKTRGDI